tara:strand:- start:46 stop:1461 length:1416 start_codon:yes stop_codon:yes gene_type:complete
MAFNAQTSHKESLQTLAMALRQDMGRDIQPIELAEEMKDLTALAPSIKNFCEIDYSKMTRDFNVWVNSDSMDWIESSCWIANSTYPTYCKGGDFTFYRQDFVPDFKGTYKKIKDKIKKNAKASILRKMYKVVGMSEDKWNPADIIAIKTSEASKTMRLLKNFEASKVSKQSAITKTKNKNSKDQLVHVMQDLDEMYEYNQLIDDLFKQNILLGISLKKANSSSVKMKVIDHKGDKGLKDSLNMNIDITDVKFLPTNQKCIVEFNMSGEKGHYFDIRGFETTTKIADVQVQLSKTGSSAAHGKITLPVVTLILKLSKGRSALSKLNSKKRSMFKGLSSSSIHGFTDAKIFNQYSKDPNKLAVHKENWARYIQFLSNSKHESTTVINEVNKLISKKQGRTSGVFDAAKYLKHKVQSYEVGHILDTNQKQIKEEIKENVIKSMVSYSGSKGMTIFNDNKAVGYMISSTYLKVGG